MKLTEIASNVANQGSLISKLLSAKTDEERASIAAQIQTVNKQLTDGLSGEIAGETIEAAVQEKLKSGEYVTKADAQKLADDAKAAAAEEAKKVQEQKDKEAARIQAIRDAKLNVEYTVPGIDKKVGEFLSTFEFNDNGDQQFAANIKLLTSIPEALVKEATPAGAEAASKNGPGGTVPQGSPGYLDRIKALAGGGPGSSPATQPSNENASQSRRGRHAFSQPVK